MNLITGGARVTDPAAIEAALGDGLGIAIRTQELEVLRPVVAIGPIAVIHDEHHRFTVPDRRRVQRALLVIATIGNTVFFTPA